MGNSKKRLGRYFVLVVYPHGKVENVLSVSANWTQILYKNGQEDATFLSAQYKRNIQNWKFYFYNNDHNHINF